MNHSELIQFRNEDIHSILRDLNVSSMEYYFKGKDLYSLDLKKGTLTVYILICDIE